MDELEVICKHLDIEVLEYLEAVKVYQNQRKRTNFLLHNGYLELAHSKYVMGSSNLSRFQYDKRMQATTLVDLSSNLLIDYQTNDQEGDLKERTLYQMTMTTNNTPLSESTSASSPSGNTRMVDVEMRNRTNKPASFQQNTQPADSYDNGKNDALSGIKSKGELIPLADFKSSNEASTKAIRKDPINWFGVLSPPSLKDAQASFQQANLELVSMVNLLLKLKDRERRILELKEKKETLIDKN